MAVNFIQPSFAAGELSPSMYARVDLAKYHIGLKLCRNFFVLPHGGISNRAGTMFVGRAVNSTYPVHLIPFQFNITQAYILEFGHQYMRVIMNGGYVLEPALPIYGIPNPSLGVWEVYNHGYNAGDQVYLANTGLLNAQTGLDDLDSTPARQYLVANPSQNYFTLTTLDGVPLNLSNYTGTLGSGATVARVYTMPTPYLGTDVQELKWAQSADVLTICHPSYQPCDLNRIQHWQWQLVPISFAPQVAAPTGVTGSAGGTGSWYYSYVVTAVGNAPPDESLPSSATTFTGAQLNSNTGVANTIDWNSVSNAVYYRVYKTTPTLQAIPSGVMYGYIGTAQGTAFVDEEIAPDFTQAPPQGTNPFSMGTITSVSVTGGGSGYPVSSTLNLSVVDSTGFGAVLQAVTNASGVITSVNVVNGGQNYSSPTISAPGAGGSGAAAYISNIADYSGAGSGYTSGISGQQLTVTVTNVGSGYTAPPIVTATPGTGCGFTASVISGAVTAISAAGSGSGYTVGQALTITPASSASGATFSATVASTGNYPGCVTYFQDRKVFAGSNAFPQTIWMTRPGDFKNMDVTNPSQATDAITVTLVANQVNAIKWLTPMNNLLVFTSGGTWMLLGGYLTQPTAVTPTNTVFAPQTAIGCADLPPIPVNYDILYVQTKGSIIRDLQYNFYAQIYTGTDMSVLSNHLFFGHNLERWCYAEQPFYQIWAVRDDGILLSFTYLKEQDVYAWAHHDSFGNSGTDQFLSVASIPEQQISGINMDSVYVVVQRTIPGVNGGNPVKYVERMDGRMFLTNGVADVTKAWFLDCAIQTSTAGATRTMTGNYQGYNWKSPQTTVTGLNHLNGCTVSVLADGAVQPSQVVVNGQITLQQPASTVTVGLPYQSQMQTLCMEPEGMAVQVQDYRKKISAVAVRVKDTLGLKVGPNFGDLTEIKIRGPAYQMGTAVPLITGDQRVVIDNQYLVDDDICIEQDYPLPCTILGVIPEVNIGDSPG